MSKDISFRNALRSVFFTPLYVIMNQAPFIGKPTTLQDFKNGHLLKGEDIRKEYLNAFHEIGGMLEVMDENNIETIPVMFAEAFTGRSV